MDLGEEGMDEEGSQATFEITNDLKTWFRSHRQTLRAELCGLKDENRKRLFSDTEIDLQIPTTAIPPPPSAVRDHPRGAEDTLNDNTFGYHVTLGHFLIPLGENASTEFRSYKIKKSEIQDRLEELSMPTEGSRRKDLFWVHLPVNNLLWVQVRHVHIIAEI